MATIPPWSIRVQAILTLVVAAMYKQEVGNMHPWWRGLQLRLACKHLLHYCMYLCAPLILIMHDIL